MHQPHRLAPPTFFVLLLILALSCGQAGPPADEATPTRARPTIDIDDLDLHGDRPEIPDNTPTPGGTAPAGAPSFPTIETFYSDEERVIWLSSNHLRVAVDKFWGGAIREIWLDGANVVNNYDGGRLIAVSFYDGFRPPASNHPNDTGWNPTPSDMYNHVNQPLAYAFSNNTLYLKHRYIQWYPDDKGGGAGTAVSGDLIVETWLRFFADPSIIHARYRVTHEGQDDHLTASHEFPFSYPRFPYKTFVTYSGSAPWTKDQVTIDSAIPIFPSVGGAVTTEQWAGLVDQNGVGLVIWAPQNYNYFVYNYFDNLGPAENAATYLTPQAFMELAPGAVREIEAFYIVGPWKTARAHIYTLNQALTFADVLDPFGTIDAPQPGASLNGKAEIAGWAIDDRQLADLTIEVDGQVVGHTPANVARPDVVNAYPGAPGGPNHGFRYLLDTTALSNGAHELKVWARDAAGNTSLMPPGPLSFTVAN